MASEWRELSLREAGVQLIDCDHRTPPAAEHGYPYIAIPQLKDGRVDLDGVRRISAQHFAEWTRKLLPKAHDVIVVRRCNSGVSAVIPDGLECAIGQNLVVLRSNGEHIHPPYLRWLVRGAEWWAEVNTYINVGAVFDSLKCKDIPNFRIPVPSIDQQKKIAGFLQAIDDRIDNLRQTNVTLEAIAQALFKSWFVDFDPVHAKAEGREPEGMDPATAALFPCEFQDSELGQIPRGWIVCALDEALEINPQRILKKGSVAPYLDMASVPTVGCVPMTPTLREFSSGSKFLNGDTLLARITPCLENGKTAYVNCLQNGQVGWGSTEFIVLRPSSPLPSFFAYLLARRPDFRAHAIQSMSGTSGRQRIELTRLKDFLVTVPSEAVANAFADVVKPVERTILENVKHADLLAELRDTLLPRLISGKLRIPEAEALVDEATG